jgi:hypothetical protein
LRIGLPLNDIPFERENNIWAFNKHFDAAKPTLLLNSHHDGKTQSLRSI